MTTYLFRCPGCQAERDHSAPSGALICVCGKVLKRVYQSGVGRVDGAGGTPGRAS